MSHEPSSSEPSSVSKYLNPLTVSMALIAILFAVMVVTIHSGPETVPTEQDDASTAQPAQLPAAPAPDWLDLVATVPLPGELLDRQIVLVFDEDVALTTEPGQTPPDPFSINPPLQGDFRLDGNCVVFKVREGEEPQYQVYEVSVNSALKSSDGKEVNPDNRRLAFSRIEFKADQLWEVSQTPEETTLGVSFPIPADLVSLNEHVAVQTSDEQDVPFSIAPGSGGSDYRLSIRDNKNWPVRITIRKGLRDAKGELELAEDQIFGFPTDPFFHVISVGWGEMREDSRDIVLQFSKPVDAEVLAANLTIADEATAAAVKFDLASYGPTVRHVVTLAPENLNKGLVKLQMPKALTGPGNTRLVKDYSVVLDLAPAMLKVEEAFWGVTDGRKHEINMRFSKPVAVSDLKANLTLSDPASGAKLAYDLLTQETQPQHTVQVTPSDPADVKVLLALSAGMPGGDYTSLRESYTQLMERPATPLQVEYTDWTYESRDGLVLLLGLNLQVNANDLMKHITIEPKVGGLSIAPEGNRRYRLSGEWDSQRPYVVKISAGVKYVGGAASKTELTHRVKSGDVPTYLGFGYEGKYYFPVREGAALEVESRNIGQARLNLHRVFPSNLMVALQDIGVNSDDYDRYGGNGKWGLVSRWSEKVGELDMDLRFEKDRLTRTPIDMARLFPADRRGVFCVQAPEHGAAKVIVFTNIGLLSHWQDDSLVIFAHNLMSLAPLEGARVTVHSSKNQVMGTADTDTRGIAVLEGFHERLGTPCVVAVEHGNDFTFLELSPSQDGMPKDMYAMPAYDREEYDAFMYADRELYRPGETVHLRWIVRNNYGDALGEVPLRLVVTSPVGREITRETKTLSSLGTDAMDLQTEKTYPTGSYVVELKVPSDDRPIGMYRFRLEDFVPNRIKTSVVVSDSIWLAGKEYEVKVHADHLFGASAADRRASCEVIIDRGTWAPEGWKDYTFGNDSQFTQQRVDCGEGQTDSDGNATFKFSYAPPADATFPMKATVIGSVFELGGRVVQGDIAATFFPSDVCVGIRATRPDSVQGIEALVACISPDGKPVALDKVKVTLEKQVWNYYVRRYYSHYESNWTDSYDEIETREVSLSDGRGSTVFGPQDYGYYRLRVHSGATRQFSTTTFYSYWGGFNAVAAGRPSLIKLSLDKERYAAGDTASLRVESPFDGKGIAVVQGEKIREMIPFEVVGNVGTVQFLIGEDYAPNVWVEATVIHTVKTDRAQVYPFSSFAMVNAPVDDPKRKLTVSLPSLPAEMRPATQAQFTVSVRDSADQPVEAELTLAAVDEGIHAITGYRSPDPLSHFSRPRRPVFQRANYYDKVAYDFVKPGIGGDGMNGLGKRAATIDENWIKPVALWSGVVRTSADGSALVTMEVPEFSGQLRLVVVACNPVATGSESKSMFVRRPYTLRTSMPRFLLPNDVAQCSAVIINTTDAPCMARLSWSTDGPFAKGEDSKEFLIPGKGEQVTIADFETGGAIGQGHIYWDAVILDAQGNEVEHLKETAPIPVRAPASFQSRHALAVIEPGQTQVFRNDAFLDDYRAEFEISATANPVYRLQEAMRYVVQYPYGCVEQTTSKLMPMYLLRKSRDFTAGAIKEDSRLDGYIAEGVGRLFSMQTASGGLGFWPGEDQPYPYGSVYALHFLTLVEKGRDVEIPQQSYEALRRYVGDLSQDWSRGGESDLYLRAYAIYVLALGGDIEAIKQIQRFDSIPIPQSARYLLAAALAQNTKDIDRVKMYLSSTPSVPYGVAEQSGTLNSAVRNAAVELMALMQMGDESEQMHKKAEDLINFVQQKHHGTTQETAFIVTALSGYLTKLAEQATQSSASITGPQGKKDITGMEVYKHCHTGPGGEFTVINTGQSNLFVNVTQRGVPEVIDAAAYDKGIRLARTLMKRDGEVHSGDAFTQTDSYVVHLEIDCERVLENVVVADLLPAGFEIENPRLNTKALPAGVFKNAVTPSYVDVRDDRMVLAFNRLRPGIQHFYYVVRAVTPGKFQYPAATAECMYDPEKRGGTATGVITVEGRKAPGQ